MPHATMKLIPGIDTNKTPALNEAAFSSSQLIRFVPDRNAMGLIQKIGGWVNWAPGVTFSSAINELHAWEDLSGVSRLAVGAANELAYIANGTTTKVPITPQGNSSDVALTTAVSQSVTFTSGNGINVSNLWGVGTAVYFTNTSGNVIANTVYWIYSAAAGVITLSSTPWGGAQTTFVTGVTSGSNTISVAPFAVVSGSSTVYITDTNLGVQTGVSVGADSNGKVLVTATTTPVSTTPIYFTGSITGSSIAVGTPYYVLPVTTNTFNLSTTSGGAAITNTSTSASNLTLYNPNQIQTGFSINLQTPISIQNLLLSGTYSVTGTVAGNTFFSVYSIQAATSATASSKGVATSAADGPLLPQLQLSVGTNTVTVIEYNQPYINGQTASFLYPTSSNGVVISGNYIVTLDTTNPSYKYTINAATAATASVTSGLYMNNGNIHIVYYYNIPSLYGASGYGSGEYGGYTGVITTQTGCTISGTTLTLGGANSSVAINQLVTGGSITPDTRGLYPYIVSGSGTSWQLSFSPGTISSFTASFQPATVGYGLGVKTTYPNGIPLTGVSDWVINNFGEVLVVNPQDGPIYYWSPTNNTTDVYLLPNAPLKNRGIFIAMPSRQLVAYGSTATGVQDSLLIRWSDAADATNWIAAANNQAGSYRIPEGSFVVGAIQGPQQALIWTDIAVWAMQYVGLPNVFGFNKLADGMGLIGKKAVGVMNGNVFWMSPEKFCMLSSGGPQPMPCPVWDQVYQNINTSLYSLIRCATNSTFGEVTWYYPTFGSSYNNAYVKYNIYTQQWDYGQLDRTAWIDQSVLGTPIGSDSNGVIYQHEMGYDADTAPMVCSFRTGFIEMNEADNLIFVDQIWPDFKWTVQDGVTTPITLYITFYGADYPGGPQTTYGPFSMDQNTNYISCRIRNRLLSIGVSTANENGVAQSNTFFRIGAIRYRYQLDGKF